MKCVYNYCIQSCFLFVYSESLSLLPNPMQTLATQATIHLQQIDTNLFIDWY